MCTHAARSLRVHDQLQARARRPERATHATELRARTHLRPTPCAAPPMQRSPRRLRLPRRPQRTCPSSNRSWRRRATAPCSKTRRRVRSSGYRGGGSRGLGWALGKPHAVRPRVLTLRFSRRLDRPSFCAPAGPLPGPSEYVKGLTLTEAATLLNIDAHDNGGPGGRGGGAQLCGAGSGRDPAQPSSMPICGSSPRAPGRWYPPDERTRCARAPTTCRPPRLTPTRTHDPPASPHSAAHMNHPLPSRPLRPPALRADGPRV